MNEDFENKRNNKIPFIHYPIKMSINEEFLGLRSSRNRSLLGVNEDFENKRNDKITVYTCFYTFLHLVYMFDTQSLNLLYKLLIIIRHDKQLIAREQL